MTEIELPTATHLTTWLTPRMIQPWRPKLGDPAVYEGVMSVDGTTVDRLLLDHNNNNRSKIPAKVIKMKNTFLDRKWNPKQSDSIATFGDDGQMQSFQHRCFGYREALKQDPSLPPFVTRVEVGHNRLNLLSIDQVDPRTEASQAHVLGRSKAERNDYAPVKTMWKILNERTQYPFERGGKTFELVDQYRPLLDIVPTALIRDRHLVQAVRGSLLVLASKWPEEVKGFCQAILNFKLDLGGGPQLLYAYLTSTTFTSEKSTYEGDWSMVRRTFKAFELYLTSTTRDRLRGDANDSYVRLRRLMDAEYETRPGCPFASDYRPRTKTKLAVDADADE